MAIKAVVLIGGPNRGQRFRPLSFDSPKYMFPVGGETILGHLIESCLKLDQLSEIILLGFYQQNEMLSPAHLQRLVQKYLNQKNQVNGDRYNQKAPSVRYLQEFTRMGTAGGLYHFRDQIKHGNPEAFLLINGDVCGDFDFESMLAQHRASIEAAKHQNNPKPLITVMTTEASPHESLNYGCIVEDSNTHLINHYVEKPSTFVSSIISCGAYVCSPELLAMLEETMRKKREDLTSSNVSLYDDLSALTTDFDSHPDYLSLELDVLQQRSTQPYCYSYRTRGSWWCQVKTATSAIYANKQYLAQYKRNQANFQNGYSWSGMKDCKASIIGDVYIHPTALIDPTSVIGPNVSIMENCIIGPGVRIKESIILQNSVINAHSLILCSIIGWNCCIGSWTRVEGTPSEPDPNQRYAKVQNPPLFNPSGKLNPLISVLGSDVKISGGNVILNSIVLPHKELTRSYKNEIVL